MPGSTVKIMPSRSDDVRGRDEERRLVDLGADRVAGAVQAGAEVRVRLDDVALGGVDAAAPSRRARVIATAAA